MKLPTVAEAGALAHSQGIRFDRKWTDKRVGHRRCKWILGHKAGVVGDLIKAINRRWPSARVRLVEAAREWGPAQTAICFNASLRGPTRFARPKTKTRCALCGHLTRRA